MTHILIVEDDPLMGRMYHKVFTFEGYEVILAENGEEGWDAIKKKKPMIALLDVMMPKMNGLQLLDKMKADPDTKFILVIMLTNLAEQSDMKIALAKGAIKYIVKSDFEPKQVVNIVREVLAEYPTI